MIHKTRSPIPGCVRTVFELPVHIWADQIYVVGDFNQWTARATPMRQERDGAWRAVVDLPSGSRCEFRYLIDGRWLSDYHADGMAGNASGSQNSVVVATLPADDLALPRTNSQVWDVPSNPVEHLLLAARPTRKGAAPARPG